MIDNRMILCIIPARGGSKGIPNKNIRLLGGIPLISWTIREGLKSNYIDRLIVTTDSKEIAKIGRKEGAEIPFMRPSELAQDDSSGSDVILHTLEWFRVNATPYELFICLQPTSPFRSVNHIDESIELMIKNEQSNALMSVSVPANHPFWMKRINHSGFLEDFTKADKEYNNRQELPPVYVVNGAIFISKWDAFMKYHSFEKGNSFPYIMDTYSSLDIDTLDDWNYAEYLLNNR